MSKFKQGDHVTIKEYPFQGRTGTIISHRRFFGYKVWCDDPDALGRRQVRVFRVKARKTEEHVTPGPTLS
jgi:ribosomal protein L21E